MRHGTPISFLKKLFYHLQTKTKFAVIGLKNNAIDQWIIKIKTIRTFYNNQVVFIIFTLI